MLYLHTVIVLMDYAQHQLKLLIFNTIDTSGAEISFEDFKQLPL